MDVNLTNLKKIAYGFTADIYQLNDEKILKLYFENWDTSFIEAEYNIARQIQSYSLLTPAALEMIQIGSRTGIIFQKLMNVTMKDKIKSDIINTKKYAKTFAGEHIKIHCTKDSDNALPVQKELYEQIINSRTSLTSEQKHSLLTLLHSLQTGDSICHGDFHPLNLLYEDDGIYVIDWVGALRGNPLADAAGSYLIIKIVGRETENSTSIIKRMLSSVVIHRFVKHYLKEYIRLSGHTKKEILQWLPIRAATYLDFGLPKKSEEQLMKIISCSNLSCSEHLIP